MFMRTYSAVGMIALLAACAGESDAPEGATIACAIGPGSELQEVCTLEAIGHDEDGIRRFVIHHPDGGFRRIGFDPQAGTIAVMDGADDAVMQESAELGQKHFTIGSDAYSIPDIRLAPDTP